MFHTLRNRNHLIDLLLAKETIHYFLLYRSCTVRWIEMFSGKMFYMTKIWSSKMDIGQKKGFVSVISLYLYSIYEKKTFILVMGSNHIWFEN